MLAIVPATFNSIPKPDCYYNFIEMSVPYKSQQNLFVVPVLKIFGTKLQVHLLCTIINTNPDNIILAKTLHIGEMKLLSNIDDTLNPPAVSEVTHDINSDHIETQWMQPNSYSSNPCKICSNSQPILTMSVLMPSTVQVHRQVLLNDKKISKETKVALYKLLQKYDSIIRKVIII